MDPATGSGWEFSKPLERDKLSEISVPFKGLWLDIGTIYATSVTFQHIKAFHIFEMNILLN